MKGDIRQPRDRASMSTANRDGIRLNGKLHVILIGRKKGLVRRVLTETKQEKDTKQLIITILVPLSQECIWPDVSQIIVKKYRKNIKK